MGRGPARRKSWAAVALALGFLAGCATTKSPTSEQRQIIAPAGTGPLVVAAARDLLSMLFLLQIQGNLLWAIQIYCPVKLYVLNSKRLKILAIFDLDTFAIFYLPNPFPLF